MSRVLEHLRSGLTWEGSTRPLGLIRIGVITLLWTRYALPFAPFRQYGDPRLTVLLFAFYIVTVLAFLGLWTRWSTLAVAVVMTLLRMVFDAGTGTGPSVGIGPWQVAVLLAFTPCGRSFSMDRWLEVRRAEERGEPPPPERAPLWTQTFLMLQISAIYVFAGLDKIDWDWLSGFRLEGIVLERFGYSELLQQAPMIHPVAVAVAWVTLVVELGLGVGLWVPRWRRVLIPVGIALHLSFFFTLALWPLSARIILLYLAFADPDRVHDVIDRLMGHGRST